MAQDDAQGGDPLIDPARLEALASTHLGASADATLDRFTGLVRRLLDVPVALVSLVDDQRQVFPGQSGLEGTWAERGTPLTHSFCQHVVRTGEPLIVQDARANDLVRTNLAVPHLGVVSYLGLPLTDDDGNVLGSLCAIDHEPRDWSQSDIDCLRDIQAAVSAELQLRILLEKLSAARTVTDESLRRAATAQTDAELSRDRAEVANQRLELLSRVGEALNSLDAEEAVGRLAPLLVPLLGDWCLISLIGEDGRRRDIGRAHRDSSKFELVTRYAGFHQDVTRHAPSSVAARTGAPVIARSLDPAMLTAAMPNPEARRVFELLDAGSVAAFPLHARDRSIGVISLVNDRARGVHTQDEIDAAAEVARRAGMALENARLFARQRRMAETLQLSLLTPPPVADSMRIAVRYRPATVDAHVGGDWYDAFCQADGSTVLVIGDVVGHDVAATADMGQLRSLVRGIAFDREDGPAGVMTRVDRAVAGLSVGTMATAIIARIDCASSTGPRTVRWSSAGHPPPLLLSPDGAVSLLDEVGDLMLGVDASATRSEGKMTVSAGSTLLLCTDGLFERRDTDIDDSLAALAETAASLAPVAQRNLEAFCDALLDRQLGRESRDDVALIAVHVL